MNHESTFLYQPEAASGVTLRLRKMTFGRRSEILSRLGALTRKAVFLDAGTSPQDQIDAERERRAADRILLEWAIESVTGLTIDGKEATTELLIDEGPENIVREVLGAIHEQIGLSTEEIKN